jgi:hypothetical protein
MIPRQEFLDLVYEVVEEEPEGMGASARLYRLGARLHAIAEALRGDPGHDVTGAVCKPTQDRTKAVWNWQRMGRALLASTGPFEPGECRVCGCTETSPCIIPVERRVSYEDGSRPDHNAIGLGACAWIGGSKQTLCDHPDCVEAARSAEVLTLSAGWRCVNCKRVLPGPDEPDRCPSCNGRAFAPVAAPDEDVLLLTEVYVPPSPAWPIALSTEPHHGGPDA